jgi:hypothetical protein
MTTNDYPYVHGNPGVVDIELWVYHGTFAREKYHGEKPWTEIQPAAMLESDRSASPSDGMYGMLDEYGDEFTEAFLREAYGRQIEFDTVRRFTHTDSDGTIQTVSYWFRKESDDRRTLA